MEIKAWIESHPYITGGAVLGLVILYFLLSSGSSSQQASASTGVAGTGLSSADYTSLQEAQIQTGAQLQAQEDAGTEATNQLNAQVAATQINANAQTVQDNLAANVQLQNILTSGQVQSQANTIQGQLGLAQTGAQVSIAQTGATENEDIATTQANTLQAQYADAIQSQQIVSDAQTQQAEANASTQTSIANYAAQVQLAGIGAQENQTNVEGAVTLAGIQTQGSVDTTAIQTQATEQENQLNYEGGVVSTVSGIVQSGVLNKGGSGGANQVSVLSSLLGTGGVAPTPSNSGFGVNIPGVGSFTGVNL